MDNLNTRLDLRLSASQHAAAQKWADAAGCSVSELVRLLLRSLETVQPASVRVGELKPVKKKHRTVNATYQRSSKPKEENAENGTEQILRQHPNTPFGGYSVRGDSEE